MDRDGVDDWRVDGTMLHLLVAAASPLDRQLFHGIENFPPRQDMPEYCVQIIEMRLSLIANEELGSVGHHQKQPAFLGLVHATLGLNGHNTLSNLSVLSFGPVTAV
jgi:hypothetical protein